MMVYNSNGWKCDDGIQNNGLKCPVSEGVYASFVVKKSSVAEKLLIFCLRASGMPSLLCVFVEECRCVFADGVCVCVCVCLWRNVGVCVLIVCVCVEGCRCGCAGG